MKHIVYCITQAARHPRIALLGAREFRLDCTTGHDSQDKLESYDSGRELAHLFTFRHWDGAY